MAVLICVYRGENDRMLIRGEMTVKLTTIEIIFHNKYYEAFEGLSVGD